MVRAFGGEVMLTESRASRRERPGSPPWPVRLDTEVVVNLQGDAPLTDPAVVAACARAALARAARR